MKTRTLLTLAAMAFSAVLLSGCGEGSKSSNNRLTGGCQAGTLFVPQYNGCFSTQSCQAGYAYVPQVGQCMPGTATGGTIYPGYNGTSHSWTGTLLITNSQTYRQMLKDWNVCGLYTVWDCDNFMGQPSVEFDLAGTTVPAAAQFIIVPGNQYQWGSYTYLTYTGTAQPINTNTGFELRATGSYASYNKIFSAIANVGTVGTGAQLLQQMRFTITYNGNQLGYADVFLRW